MTATKTALILGATGGIGGALATALSRRGWDITALHRNAPINAAGKAGAPVGTAGAAVGKVSDAAGRASAVTWIRGDALNPDDVTRAARGAALIVHAVNPPGYRNWAQWVLPMLDSSIQAARATGARILLPGTIYNYGPDAFPLLREDSPQNPLTRKGKIRAEMESRLRRAAGSGVRSLIVRAGDFFGPRAGNNWFSQGLIKPGQVVKSISYPGRPHVGHAWAYLPDVAATMTELVERESQLGTFETFHFAGHWDADGMQMTHAIRVAARAGNRPEAIPVRKFPWPAISLLSPLVTLFREMREMQYLWSEPLRLSNEKLLSVLGMEAQTPLVDAVRATLLGLGCLRDA